MSANRLAVASTRGRHDRRQFLALLGAALAVPVLDTGASAHGLAQAAGAAGRFPVTDSLLRRMVAEHKVANAVVAIGRAGAPPSFLSAGPIAIGGSAPAGPDSLYRIYSMTKPITGIATMLLVEDGKLTLDTPLADIFPEYARMNVLVDPTKGLDARPAKTQILIRHLITHTSGLSYDLMGDLPLSNLYREQGLMPHAAITPEPPSRRPESLIAFAQKVAAAPLMFDPGAMFYYAIGLDIAGAVVERVSGHPFDQFLAQRLFEPLRMNDTGFTVPASKIGRLGPIYVASPEGLKPQDIPPDSVFARPPAFPYGGAGLVSTAHDYDRFLAMLLGEGMHDGVRVMKTETARLAMSDLLPKGASLPDDFGGGGFGAGGRVSTADVAGGQGAGTFGWGGAAGTIAWVDRKKGIRASGFIQKYPPGDGPFGADLAAAVYRDLG